MSIIGKNIKRIRIEKGLNQLDLANKIIDEKGNTISRVTITRYENGRDPNIEMLHKIADALGVPISELMGIEPIGDTFINDDGKTTHVFLQNNGEITESIALQSIATYINHIANKEDYVMGSFNDDYKEIITMIEEIVRNKIIAYKQILGTRITDSNRRKTTLDSFKEMLAENVIEISKGKEPDETTLELIKQYSKYLPDEMQDEIKKHLEKKND